MCNSLTSAVFSSESFGTIYSETQEENPCSKSPIITHRSWKISSKHNIISVNEESVHWIIRIIISQGWVVISYFNKQLCFSLQYNM